MTFENRNQIIEALVKEFGEKPGSFNNNGRTKSREKFWTYNRLHQYYWNLKCGMIQTYRTHYNEKTGYYELNAQ